jgi:hypothetical protein
MSIRLPSILIVCASLGLAACSAAAPGYIPEGGRKGGSERLKAFEAGEISAAGSYEPSKAERDLDCRRLTGSMQVIITRLKDATNRPPPSALTRNLEDATTAVTKRPRLMDMDAEHRREAARLVAYNNLLAEKKCPTLDLAAHGLPELGKR